jgi:hypothetical protein
VLAAHLALTAVLPHELLSLAHQAVSTTTLLGSAVLASHELVGCVLGVAHQVVATSATLLAWQVHTLAAAVLQVQATRFHSLYKLLPVGDTSHRRHKQADALLLRHFLSRQSRSYPCWLLLRSLWCKIHQPISPAHGCGTGNEAHRTHLSHKLLGLTHQAPVLATLLASLAAHELASSLLDLLLKAAHWVPEGQSV